MIDIKKYLKGSFFVKLIFTYSVIIVFILLVLVYFIKNNLSNIVYNQQRSFENQITERVSTYMNSSLMSAKEIVQRIYISNSDTKVHIFSFLKNNGETVSFNSLSDRENFDKLFSSQLGRDNNILDIIIYKIVNKEVISYTKNIRRIDNDYNYHKYPWFKEILENGENLRVIPSYKPDYVYGDNRYIYSAAASIFDANNLKTSGEIIINLEARQIENSYKNYKNSMKGFILVTDEKGNVIYDSSNKYYGRVYPYFDKLKQNDDYVMLDEKSMISINSSNNDGFIVAGIIPQKQVLKSINSIVNTIYFVMLICIFISLVLIFIASNIFAKRIRIVTNAMKKVEKGDLKIRVPISKKTDEIEQISYSFNKMCDRLSGYIDKEYLSEIKYKEAELTALQNQINPHFLYNTLEAIRMEAITNSDNDVGDMIYSLAYLFRTSVKNTDKLIKLKDEIEYIKSYLDIHKIRYKDRLRVDFNISDEILDFSIPKLTIQPIIENSIIHGGLNSTMDKMKINISGSLNEGVIEIVIVDNGVGIEEKTLNLLKKQFVENNKNKLNASIGLKNVSDRIKMIFGQNFGISIDSIEGSFTKVIILIPAKNVEEMNRSV